MEDDKPKRPPAWSSTDRQRLDDFLDEQKFEEKLRARRKLQIDAAKAWATWLISMAAAISLVKDWVVKLWHQLIN